MNYVARKGDTLTLENDKKYIVLDAFEFENEPYLLLINSPEGYIQNIDKNLAYKFAKEIVDLNSEEYSIEIVKDKDLIIKLFSTIKESNKANN